MMMPPFFSTPAATAFWKRLLLLFTSVSTVWLHLGVLKPDIPVWPVQGDKATSAAAFSFPVGLAPALSGTFGELRNQHFHTGLDIRTGGQEGAPVFAAEDGFVSRISIQPSSYGNCLQVKHPDGSTTLYAHLQKFGPGLAERLYQEQMATKQFLQEVQLGRSEFPVKKGDIIAWSGNSGASHGPHLHFEWRDPEDNALNPLLHYAGMLEDNISPVVQEIGLEPLTAASRVQGAWEKWTARPTGSDGAYEIPGIIALSGPVGVEYRGYDLMNGSGFSCGINRAKLLLDGKLLFDLSLDRFPIDWRRSVNIHMDYDWFCKTGHRLERCYREPGNPLPFFEHSPGDGFLTLNDTAVHEIVVELRDMHGNASTVRMHARRQEPATGISGGTYGNGSRVWHEIRRNTLMVSILDPTPSQARGLMYRNQAGKTQVLPPACRQGRTMTYLLPLHEGDFPDVVYDQSGRVNLSFDLVKSVPANKNTLVTVSEELKIFFPYGSLFQELALEVKRQPRNRDQQSDSYSIGSEQVPMRDVMVVGFRPPARTQHPENLVVCQRKGGQWVFIGNSRDQDGTIMASTHLFGEFCLMADSTGPLLTPVNVRENSRIPASQPSLTFRASDQLSSIDLTKIFCTLDGEWILFEYNPRTSQLYHVLRNRPTPGEHLLKMKVFDKAGNMTEQAFSLVF